jgi:hypothetical protein
MVLAIPFFSTDRRDAPVCTAYMPRWQIRIQRARGYACHPALFHNGEPSPRPKFRRYFDRPGIEFMESADWSRRHDEDAI